MGTDTLITITLGGVLGGTTGAAVGVPHGAMVMVGTRAPTFMDVGGTRHTLARTQLGQIPIRAITALVAGLLFRTLGQVRWELRVGGVTLIFIPATRLEDEGLPGTTRTLVLLPVLVPDMQATSTPATQLPDAAPLPTTQIRELASQREKTTSMPGETEPYIATTGRTAVGHRTAAMDGNLQAGLRIYNSSKAHALRGRCALRASAPWAECVAECADANCELIHRHKALDSANGPDFIPNYSQTTASFMAHQASCFMHLMQRMKILVRLRRQ